LSSGAPTANQVFGGWFPIRELEPKALGKKADRYDSPTLEHQFGFRAKEEGTYGEQPLRGREANGYSRGMPQLSHEFCIWQRVGCGKIDNSLNIAVRDQELNRTDEIGIMYPRNELSSRSNRTAQPHAHQTTNKWFTESASSAFPRKASTTKTRPFLSRVRATHTVIAILSTRYVTKQPTMYIATRYLNAFNLLCNQDDGAIATPR
jgi:hypothetical protein